MAERWGRPEPGLMVLAVQEPRPEDFLGAAAPGGVRIDLGRLIQPHLPADDRRPGLVAVSIARGWRVRVGGRSRLARPQHPKLAQQVDRRPGALEGLQHQREEVVAVDSVASGDEVALCLPADYVARDVFVPSNLVIKLGRGRAGMKELRSGGNPSPGLLCSPASRSTSTIPRGRGAISWCYCYARVRVATRLGHGR
jgi:hypothetical protein